MADHGIIPIDNSEADRIGLAIAGKLEVDPKRILSGSLRFEIIGGEADARIRWEGFATMPAAEVLAIVNGASGAEHG